jgi:hypothetical protein
MDALPLGFFRAVCILALPDEVLLRMACDLSRSPGFHCPPRNVSPITLSIFGKPLKEQPDKKSKILTSKIDHNFKIDSSIQIHMMTYPNKILPITSEQKYFQIFIPNYNNLKANSKRSNQEMRCQLNYNLNQLNQNSPMLLFSPRDAAASLFASALRPAT